MKWRCPWCLEDTGTGESCHGLATHICYQNYQGKSPLKRCAPQKITFKPSPRHFHGNQYSPACPGNNRHNARHSPTRTKGLQNKRGWESTKAISTTHNGDGSSFSCVYSWNISPTHVAPAPTPPTSTCLVARSMHSPVLFSFFFSFSFFVVPQFI